MRKPDDPDTRIKFFAEEELCRVGGPFFDVNGNLVANELRRRDCVMGEMRKNKPPFCLALNRAASDEIARHCKHCTERGVTKLHESGTTLAGGMGVPVLEDGRIDRSPLSGFLENGQESRQKAVPCVSER